MFFVLSPGRSGSQTIAHVLTQSPGCVCLHEPHPQLVRESARYRYGKMAHDKAVGVLRATRPAQVGGQRYGESNNRLALMVPALRDAFPQAQVVTLLRDGRDFVASEVQRGAYADVRRPPWAVSRWDRWRLRGDRAGAVDAAVWEGWDPFQKVCWQWAHVHRLLAGDLATLGPDQHRIVRIEDLAGVVGDLCEWLRLPAVDFVVPRANRRRTVDDPSGRDVSLPNNVGAIGTWRDWTAEMRDTFTRHCGDLMDAHYPGWRTGDGEWHDTPSAAAGQEPPHQGADARARAAELEVRLREAESAFDDLVGSGRALAWRMAVLVGGRARRAGRNVGGRLRTIRHDA